MIVDPGAKDRKEPRYESTEAILNQAQDQTQK